MYSAHGLTAARHLPRYKAIIDNNIVGVIAALEKNEYATNQGSLPWELAFEYPEHHALNLFVMHELLRGNPLFCPAERIVAYLKTKKGRDSMKETVAACFNQNIAYVEIIRGLAKNTNSLFYLGIHPHRINPISSGPSTTFRDILKMCNDAEEQYAAHQQKCKRK